MPGASLRRMKIFVITALAVALLAGCAMPGNAAPVIKIGVIAPFEGLGRPLGYEILPVVKAAVAEANAGGKLGRYRAAVIALNDDLDPATAAAQARALVLDADVIAVLGPWTTTTANAVAPVLTASGIPWLPAASLPSPPAATYPLCPPLDQVTATLITAFPGTSLPLPEALPTAPAIFHSGEAAAAAADLARWRAAGWSGILVGGPDLVQPWFAALAGPAAEGTQAVTCHAGQRGDMAPWQALAEAGAQVLLQALAADIADHGRPTRSGVAAALANAPGSVGLTWYRLQDGRWMAAP